MALFQWLLPHCPSCQTRLPLNAGFAIGGKTQCSACVTKLVRRKGWIVFFRFAVSLVLTWLVFVLIDVVCFPDRPFMAVFPLALLNTAALILPGVFLTRYDLATTTPPDESRATGINDHGVDDYGNRAIRDD